MEKLLNILSNIRPDVDFIHEEKLITDGVLDSVDILNIITSVNDAYSINLPILDIEPENFENLQALNSFISKYI